MKKPCKSKVRIYTACLIGLNEYLEEFPGEKASSKFDETELNEILLNSMPNGWTSQGYWQGFDCEPITLKNM